MLKFSFFKEEMMYNIIITKPCPNNTLTWSFPLYGFIYGGFIAPSSESFKKGEFGFIPVGTKGKIIKKWGKFWFSPDSGQPGLDLFIPNGESNVLLPYNKIRGYYKKVDWIVK